MEELFPWELLPESMKSEDTKAISYAVGKGMHRLLSCMPGASGYAVMDVLPEEIIDLLAMELKTQYYRQDLPLPVKRKLVKQTMSWYTKAGTPSVIEEYLGTVFEGGKVEEWFQYGGDPYFFKAMIRADPDTEITKKDNREIRESIFQYKNVRSWLEMIIYQFLLTWYVKIRAEPRMTVRTEFYPRENRPYLFLDGLWNLDGTYWLNDYRGQAPEEYRVRLGVRSEWNVEAAAGGSLTVEKDLWYLDGTYALDGGKFLDAEVIQYEI